MTDAFGIRKFDETYRLVDYLDQSAFDEKFEIDLARDEVRNIYHVENKFYVPIMAGSYRELYEYGKRHMVHPDEHIFRDLLDPDTIEERLLTSEFPGLLKAECREKLVDGTYRWVQYIGISGAHNGVPDQKILFYVFDIQNQKDRLDGRKPAVHAMESRNALTGLLTQDVFVPAAAELIHTHAGPWCCLAIDIQHFKIFRAWFGEEKCSYVLARIGALLRELEQAEPTVAAYFGRDNFGLVMRHDPQRIRDLFSRIREIIYSYSNMAGFLPAFGVNLLEHTDKVELAIYDKARMAVEDAKKSYTDRICYYDSQAYSRKKAEYAMLTAFQRALNSQEIRFFLQPQCTISTGRIVGAEALARWIKPDGSIVPPAQFIPFLEKNGLVTDLDKCVWEDVCRWLRDLIDRGLSPIPVSINVSQVDLLSLDVAAYLYGLTERYRVPSHLLKVEITESAYAENFETISRAVTQLKEKGFLVLMDDFGAGYSSLNMLDKVNADVLKLDMAFMSKNSALSRKGVSIVESIIGMTKTLRIPVIIEGVENAEQVAFLETLGCRYAQGYYFYRPMPIADFEALLQDESRLDRSGLRSRTTELFHSREFLNETLFTDTVLNHILGPVAFYTQKPNGELNITRFNQQFYNCIADVNMESRQNAIQNYILPEDHPAFYRMLEDACQDPVNGGKCTVRFMKSGGGVFWYNMHLFFLLENEQGKVFYGKIANATEMYQQGVAFYDLLKAGADSCMRIDLATGLIYELSKQKPFDDPDARVMDVDQSLRITAEQHLADPVDRKLFLDFFDPKRLKQAQEAGIYSEAIRVRFRLGRRTVITRFTTYHIQFMPDQEDNVYIFANEEFE